MCILHTHLIFFPINNHPFRHIFITTHYAMNSKFINQLYHFIISYRKSKRSFLIWVCQKLNTHTWINTAQLRHFFNLQIIRSCIFFHFPCIALQLQFCHVSVNSAFFQKFLRCALFCCLSILQNNDIICVCNRPHAMSNN